MSHLINLLDLQTPIHLRTGLEHRNQFQFGEIEINIFETYQASTQVRLQYEGLSISSMIRGTKKIHTTDGQSFDLVPGTSLVLPEGEILLADFPDANLQNPVQCATILINQQTIGKKLAFLNEHYPVSNEEWTLELEQFHFKNNAAWVRAVNELLQTALQDPSNLVLSDLLLKSLLVRIVTEQKMQKKNQAEIWHPDALKRVKKHISTHLGERIKTEDLSQIANCSKSSVYKMFEEYCGSSPGTYILEQRMIKAKNLLLHPNSYISEIAYLCGFNTVSYFVKQFKAHNQCTPGEYSKKFRI